MGLILVCAWEKEQGGNMSIVITSFCILNEECLTYYLTICWFFVLRIVYYQHAKFQFLLLPTQDSPWTPWARRLKWKLNYLWLVVSMHAFSPFLVVSLYFKCNLNERTLGFKEVYLKHTQGWHLILALPSTTFFNSGDEEFTFIWGLVLEAFLWCHHMCVSMIPLPTFH